MRLHFENELEQIQKMVRELGKRVLHNIEGTTHALLHADPERIADVLHSENTVDSLEVRIEEECIKAIALNQPVADDLRFLITILRADQNLERISDLAAGVAKIARRVSFDEIAPYQENLGILGREVYNLVESSLESLLTQDGEAARNIWLHDKEIDSLRDILIDRLRKDLLAAPATDYTRFYLIDAVNRFERMADHGTNMAKAVLYLVLGKIVRHRGGELRRRELGEKTRVLFVCVHNSARSQMAAAWLHHLHGDRYIAESAGLSPGEINPLAVEAMREYGIDISGNQPRDVFAVAKENSQFDYVITVCDAASAERCPPELGIAEQLQWKFDDPSHFQGTQEERLEQTRHIRDEIRARVENWIAVSRVER